MAKGDQPKNPPVIEKIGSPNAMCSNMHSKISKTFIGIKRYVYAKCFRKYLFSFSDSIKW